MAGSGDPSIVGLPQEKVFLLQNTRHPPPAPVPFFGNTFDNFTRSKHNMYIIDDCYKAFPNDRFVGRYEFLTPTLMVKDKELLKKICVKHFDHFIDHGFFANDNDVLFSKSLLSMRGEKWRDMRSTLSPAFTGSKLKGMVQFMQACTNNLQEYLEDEIKKNKDEKIDVDVKDLLTRYTNDVIATCAFGLNINSISNKTNEFYAMGHLLTSFSLWRFIKIMLMSFIPKIEKIRGLEAFPPKAINFFKGIILCTMRRRERDNIYRPDKLQLFMQAQKGTLKDDEKVTPMKDAGFATVLESDIGINTKKLVWDDDHIVAQALLFFLAGFDTVSTSTTMLLHELAVNTEIQDRLRQEIDELWQRHLGMLDYEKINQMKYLDMCISESLRKWPITGFTDRKCMRSYNLGKPNGEATEYIVPTGMTLTIPIFSIHRDEKYYPNPLKFDPERFSEENKHKITPFNYIPFGIGPRSCIGSRFALSEIKILAICILRHFEVALSPTTLVPLELDKNTVFLRLAGGHNLVFSLRETVI